MPVERLGFRIAPLVSIKRRQVVDAHDGLGMLPTDYPLTCFKGALVKWLGLAVTALVAIKLLTLRSV